MVISLSILVPGTILAANTPAQSDYWKYSAECRPISHDLPYNGIYLNKNVYAHSQSDLADLRVVNDKEQFVPYYLIDGFDRYIKDAVHYYYQAALIHFHSKDNDTFHDFQIASAPNEDVIVNKLILDIPTDSFLCAAMVYGSFDNLHWDYIAEETIYKVDHHIQTEIDLPQPFKYTYYRIILKENTNHIRIASIHPLYSEDIEIYKEYSRSTPLDFEIASTDGTSQVTVHNPDRLVVKSVQVIADGNFSRDYTLSGTTNGGLLPLGTGTIYQIAVGNKTAAQTDISIPASGSRWNSYTITIKNLDDLPLHITGIQATYTIHKLVYPSQDGLCSLWYGNSSAAKPSYDIERYKDKIANNDIYTFALGKEHIIIVDKPQPAVNQKLIFNIVITITSLVLILLIVNKLTIKRESL